MEAVPRLPMCSFDLKISPSNTEFGPPIKKYIADFYHEQPESYNKEIKELEALRQSACKVPRDFTGCRILKRYFAQLHSLESRFPLSENGAASVAFMWTDIYSGMVFNITDVHYEQACILYNIGALHSELGANDLRTNEEGMKVACTHFQCAAWAFQHLRETYPQLKGSDMSYDLLTFFITLMLAQAQECILEKSMLDSRKSSITAKIAAQVVEFYRSAFSTLTATTGDGDCILAIVGAKLFKHWKKVVEFKIAYYMSISHLYMGNQAEEQQLMGERVAWYSSALEKHEEATKIAKGIDREDLNEALAFTLDVIAGKCNAAKKENDFVYHEKVVAIDSLPDIKGASLVKGVPFSVTDPDVFGPDIFVKLIPMEAHEASSIYSEEKAKILRDTAAKLDYKNQELNAFMSSLNLDQDILFPKIEKIPQELLEKCAALSVKPTVIQDLKRSLSGLLEIYQEVDNSLKEVKECLQREDEHEKQHQESFGRRAPSLITVELRKESSKYEAAHQRAAESNATLQKALELHESNLQLLLSPLEQLKEALPSVSMLDAPNQEAVVQELAMLLNKVEEMKKQRLMLEQQLRESIQNDDITKLLVTRDKDDSLQKLFEEQLKKHDNILSFLEKNLSAQDNILRALTNANAHYADTRRNISEALRKRDMMVGSLLSSYDAYEDLTLKTQKGLEFYQRLRTNVQQLQARVRSVTSVQEEERVQIGQAQAKKASKAAALQSAAPITNMSPVATGSKLKDYLPYMTKKGQVSGTVTPPVPGSAWPTASRVAPNENMQVPGIASPLNNEQSEYTVGSTYATENTTPIGIRPTPVGSEYTPSVSCSSNNAYDSTLAGAMGIHDSKIGETGDKTWSYGPYYGGLSNANVSYGAASLASTAPSTTASTIAYTMPQQMNYGSTTAVPVNTTVSTLPQQYLNPTFAISGQLYSDQRVNPTPNYSQTSSTTYISPQGAFHGNVSSGQNVPSFYSTSQSYMGRESINESTTPVTYPNSLITSSNSAHPYVSYTQNYTGIAENNSALPSFAPTSTTQSYTTGSPSVSSYNYSAPATQMYHTSTNQTYPQTSTNLQTYPESSGNQTYPQNSSNVQTYSSQTNPSYTQIPADQMFSQAPTTQAYIPISSTQSFQAVQSQMPATQVYSHSNSASGFTSDYSKPNVYETYKPVVNTDPVVKQEYSNPQASVPQNYYSTTSSTQDYSAVYSTSGYNQLETQPQQQILSQQSYPTNQATSVQSNVYDVTAQMYNLAVNDQPTVQAEYMHAASYSQGYMSGNYYTGSVSQKQPVNQMGNAVQSDIQTSQQCGYQNYDTSNINQQTNAYQMETSTIGFAPSGYPQQYNTSVGVSSSDSISNQQLQSAKLSYASDLAGIAPLQPTILSPRKYVEPVESQPIKPTEIIAPTVQPSQPVSKATSSISGGSISSASSSRSSVSCSPSHQKADDKKDSLESFAGALSSKMDDFLKPAPKARVASSEQTNEKPDENIYTKDPLLDSTILERFTAEVDKFKKVVEGLTKKSLNGPTPLDQKWKEITDSQDKESRKSSISVARCYPLKNRIPDVMPYDSNRVELQSLKNDYINASYIKNLIAGFPKYIVTQAPMSTTLVDFWVMVWEQQVEAVVCIITAAELKGQVYWPTERGQALMYGPHTLSLQSSKEFQFYTESMISITHNETKMSRMVIHLQFLSWPPGGIPSNPSLFLQFINEVHSYHKQQRNSQRPILVHCLSGVGRSGVFCLLSAAMKELALGHNPPDLSLLATKASHQRKFILQEKEHLKFCYEAALYHAQDILVKCGILSNKTTFDEKIPDVKTHTRHPSQDFILGGLVPKLEKPVETDIVKLDSKDNSGENVDSGSENVPPITKAVDAIGVSNETNVVEAPAPRPEVVQSVSKDSSLSLVTSILDPANFTLEPLSSKRKFSKECFQNPLGLVQPPSNANDPLSQLDPLWTMKKE